MNVLFRCDGSKEIGLGHVSRCLALAEELKSAQGCTVTFAMRRSALGVGMVEKHFPVLMPDEGLFDYESWLSGCISRTLADILVCDVRDGLNLDVVERMKKIYTLLVVDIDDPEDKRIAADLAFYPPVPQIRRMNWDRFEGELYSGWEYIILRKEFRDDYEKPDNKVPVVLVSMGGSDPNNLTTFIIDVLQDLDVPFALKVMIGAGFNNEITEKVKTGFTKHIPEIIENCSSVARLMSEADLAIASFGVTAYELASMGVPSLFVYLTEDHEASASAFVENGYGESLGICGALSPEVIRDKVRKSLHVVTNTGRGNFPDRKVISGGSRLIARLITDKRAFNATN